MNTRGTMAFLLEGANPKISNVFNVVEWKLDRSAKGREWKDGNNWGLLTCEIPELNSIYLWSWIGMI